VYSFNKAVSWSVMRYPVFLVDVLTDGLQLGTGWQSGGVAGLLYRSQQLTMHLSTQQGNRYQTSLLGKTSII